MSVINGIDNVQLLNQIKPQDREGVETRKDAKEKISFADTIKDFVSAVNDKQLNAGEKVQEIIESRSENLAEAMSAMEESRLSFQLMLEVRNKLMESFQEINRMQV